MVCVALQAIGMQACQPHATRFGRNTLGCHAPDYYRMLQHDLVILGVDAAQLPCFDLADDTTDAGVFYVVAGSRMGAAVLRNRATAPTPVGIANGVCGYFMPGEGPAMWRRFREWLVGTPDDLAAMIEGAKAAFHLFAQAGQWAADQPVLPPLQGARGLAA